MAGSSRAELSPVVQLSEAVPDAVLFQQRSYALETRPNDLDRLGHVNNAVALEYLEAARWDWAERLGLKELNRIVAVVSRVEVDYLAQILPGRVVIKTQLSPAGLCDQWREELNYRAVVEQSIWSRSAERELVRARVTLAFIDRETNSLRTLQDCFL